MNCLDGLKLLPDESIDVCVTSPPYWGLRDYGVEGQIGLEITPDEYVKQLVEVFREVRRVLKDNGTLWLNLGDSYANSVNAGNKVFGNPEFNKNRPSRSDTRTPKRITPEGLKPKDLVGIPWMVAFALRADGWFLRSDIIWEKPNAMPESVKDRPTKAHEYIFLLTKSGKYYYDFEAIKEPSANAGKTVILGEKSFSKGQAKGKGVSPSGNGKADTYNVPQFKNKRTIWKVSTKPFREAHFAVFPPDLIKPCILAGSPEGGIVLDPFMGAGTTGVVSKHLGRNFVGYELNPEYVTIAEKRIREAVNKWAI